uniref:Uncharacterized protein n=1 Tax=Sinocyclocheilus rhinocerous TaxID=307959 RepID=A0A673L588_9TELE
MRIIEKTSKGIFMLKGRAEKEPSDVVIVLEAVIVLQDLHNLAFATVVLFGLLYILNLKYPRKLRYTSEILQKVIMEEELTVLWARPPLPCMPWLSCKYSKPRN